MKMYFSALFTKDSRFLISLWVLFWLVFHFCTIGISPIPWFDEVFFADLADSVNDTGRMYLRMITHVEGDDTEILIYGPVYFYIQAFLIRLFGLHLEVFRALNLVSGVLIVFLSYMTAKWLNLNKWTLVFAIFLITTDTVFHSNMHSGRMDLFAALLFYLALVLFVFKRKTFRIPLYGLVFAASFLSTPRVGFYFIALIPLFISELIQRKTSIGIILMNYSVLAIAFATPLLIWILCKFGGIESYISYFLESTLVQSHTGIKLVPNMYQLPVIVIWFLLLIAIIIKRRFALIDVILNLIIIVHLLFIKEVGPYSAMIMPVIYLAVLHFSQRFQDVAIMNKISKIFLIIVLLFNTGIFILKAGLVIADRGVRSPKLTSQQLMSYDFTGKTIMADFKYYYLIKNQGGIFLSYDLVADPLDTSIIHVIDYMMISEEDFRTFSDKYSDHIAKIIPLDTERQSDIYEIIRRFGYNIGANYRGFLIELNDSN